MSDLISRQDAIYLCQERLYETACNSIGYGCKADELSAQPERKKGKWIILDDCANEGIYCSECHKKVLRYDYSNTMKLKNFKYCPNCGSFNGGDNNVNE